MMGLKNKEACLLAQLVSHTSHYLITLQDFADNGAIEHKIVFDDAEESLKKCLAECTAYLTETA